MLGVHGPVTALLRRVANWSCKIQADSTTQETWRRDWSKRRSRDCDVTCSNENSLKKLTHYGDRDDIPLALAFYEFCCLLVTQPIPDLCVKSKSTEYPLDGS